MTTPKTPEERSANLKSQLKAMAPAIEDAQRRAKFGMGNQTRLAFVLPRTGGGYTVIQFEAMEDGFRTSLVDCEGENPWQAAIQVMHEWTGSELVLHKEEPPR